MKILAIGETCEDIFIYGKCSRLNPEAPTPVFIPSSEIKNKGMLGNVVNNIKSLGYECDIITNKEKLIKKRYVDEESNYILLRVDIEENINEKLIFDEIENIEQYDLVIISDYNKGFLNKEIIEYIGKKSKCSFLDTKKKLGHWSKYCSYIKINLKESLLSKNIIKTPEFYNKVIITMGKDGCELGDAHIPTGKVEVRDVVGAGDTFLATLSVKYIETNDIYESMKFANKCSSQVIQKRGTSIIEKLKH